jgi:hypothetical protein
MKSNNVPLSNPQIQSTYTSSNQQKIGYQVVAPCHVTFGIYNNSITILLTEIDRIATPISAPCFTFAWNSTKH